MLCIHLDQHGGFAVDQHRMHDRSIQLPVIGQALGLDERKVVALRTFHDLIALDDADGDKDGIGPIMICIKLDRVLFVRININAVPLHGERHRRMFIVIVFIFVRMIEIVIP